MLCAVHCPLETSSPDFGKKKPSVKCNAYRAINNLVLYHTNDIYFYSYDFEIYGRINYLNICGDHDT